MDLLKFRARRLYLMLWLFLQILQQTVGFSVFHDDTRTTSAPPPTKLIEPSIITHRLARTLTMQLILVLKREEAAWQSPDLLKSKSKQVEITARWLSTRLQYGCTALEYVQAAANLEFQANSDIEEILDTDESAFFYGGEIPEESDERDSQIILTEEFQVGRPLEVLESNVDPLKRALKRSVKTLDETDIADSSSDSMIKEKYQDMSEGDIDRVSDDVKMAISYAPGEITGSQAHRIRRESAAISHAFQCREFNPPLFVRNGHLQTIAGYFARENNKFLSEFQWDERKRMATPDNDFFNVDWKYSDSEERVGRPSYDVPIVLICHGLQSSSNSPQVKDMTRAFNNVGMDVAAINFRGCCGELNDGPFGYHLSFTDDLKLMVEHVSATRPDSRIYLSGFSLGANAVTKFLTAIGADALEKYNICGAAVNAVPFNVTRTAPNLNEPGISKFLYGNSLLDSLRDRILENFDDQDYGFTKEELMDCKTIIELEDLAVCDVHGFDGYRDYHEKSSPIGQLDEIAVPELVIQALDDPFFQGNAKPENNPNLPFRVHYTEHGGHCGFFSPQDDEEKPNFMPAELARFLKHIEDQKAIQENLHKLNIRADNESIQTRKQAASISHSFQTRDFSPIWYSLNPHFQTVVGALYRKETMYASDDLPQLLAEFSDVKDTFEWDFRQRMETLDGDFFDIDWKILSLDFESDEVPLVIICHGLQANSESPLVKDMTVAFQNAGMGVVCINFRGCSGESNRTPRSYHLGFTDDLDQVVNYINSKYPGKRIYLSGFSLGANVVTKFLADIGEEAYERNIRGAAVNAVPFDVSKSWVNLNQDGFSKNLYGDRLLQSMIERIEEMYDTVEFPFEREKIRECKTIMDMENLVVAPFFGFDDAWDYYEKARTLHILDRVSVPQLIIQSKDDPFMQGQQNPVGEPDWPLRLQYTDHGGHCGHVFHSKEDGGYETSWMPTELARFLSYIELCLASANDEDERASNFESKPTVLQLEHRKSIV